MRYFLVDPEAIETGTPSITGSDVRHIRKVLRLGPGDRIGLLDGRGKAYEAQIKGVYVDRVAVEIIAVRSAAQDQGVEIGVAQALLKDKKMDGLIRQLTELGITDWFPFVSERSIPRPASDRSQHRVNRWQKIVRESVKQCRRPTVPRVHEPTTWEELLAATRAWDLKLLFWEAAEASPPAPPIGRASHAVRRLLLVLGPEGGFSKAEVEQAKADGFATATLGPRILRAETAAVAACTLAQFLYGDLRNPSR